MQDRLTIRMTPELIDRLDAWIATQPNFVGRQKAMRQLVISALDQQGQQSSTVNQSPGREAM